VAHGQEGDAAEGELAVVKAKAVTVLSPEELARKRSPDFRLPFGCPTGPWGTATDALHEINHWAADHKKPGGGWSVTWLKGVLPGNSARGPQRVLGCALHKKEGCGWQGRLEQTQEGWMWYAFTEHTGGEGKQPAVGCGHSHALAVSLGQRLAHAGMREIIVYRVGPLARNSTHKKLASVRRAAPERFFKKESVPWGGCGSRRL
jgi:hypothetical protein